MSNNNGRGFMRRVQNFFAGGNQGTARGAEQARNNAQRGGASIDLDALLGSVLGGFQDFENAAVAAAMEASMRDSHQRPSGSPPASTNAIRNLPQIRIKGEDLVDPVNRECCVCMEPHELSGTAVRLPCAHIFHKECILNWLKAHCTCPVCRYELPTDDPSFERQRVLRMRNRKPRYARHELERLTIKELKRLLPPRDHYQAVDRADLVDHLVQSNAIDLIASPEPVEYSLSALRQMSVSQLKRCMNEEAGVFFDPKDVVEKEDMIRIFQMSGRLSILPEDTEEEQANAPLARDAGDFLDPVSTGETREEPLVETVMDEEQTAQMDTRTNTTIVMEENHDPDIQNPDAHCQFENDSSLPESTEMEENNYIQNPQSIDIDQNLLQENVVCWTPRQNETMHTESDDKEDSYTHTENFGQSDHANASDPTIDETRENTGTTVLPTSGDGPTSGVGSENHLPSSYQPQNNETDDQKLESLTAYASAPRPAELTEVNLYSSGNGEQSDVTKRDDESASATVTIDDDHHALANRIVKGNDSDSYSEENSGDDSEAPSRRHRKRSLPTEGPSRMEEDSEIWEPSTSRFAKLSISELRRLGSELSVDLSDCIERQEMVDKLSEHGSELSGQSSNLLDFGDSTTSELRLVASVVGVSVQHGERSDLISAMNTEVKQRPHIASFVMALLPIVRLTVPQLRSVARDRGIDVRDCLEKTDILRRLVDS